MLILASNVAWLEAALRRSSRFEQLGVLRDGPGSFGWQAQSVQDPMGLGLPSAVAALSSALASGQLESVHGFVRLEMPTLLEVHFTSRGRPEDLQRQIELALTGLRLAGTLFADSAKVWSFLSRAQTRVEPPQQVVLTAEWTETEIDAAAAAAARWVQGLLR